MPANIQHTHLTDEALLLAYKNSKDTCWLGYLLERYTTLLFGVACKYLKNKSLAEDAVQQVFLKVLTNLPKEEILNFKGWLYILMRNYCLQQLRDNRRFIDDTGLENIATDEQDYTGILWQEYSLELINQALEEINEEQRQTIVLFYLKKYSYEQIIAQTGYNFMQVKSYIQNGKRNLKNILSKKIGNQYK